MISSSFTFLFSNNIKLNIPNSSRSSNLFSSKQYRSKLFQSIASNKNLASDSINLNHISVHDEISNTKQVINTKI